MGNGERTRIAVLGGGMSALVAAFEMTSAPDWSEHYEIDVYQLGWRLGGKGASGRNRRRHMRIEEHGLHIFLGFYDNAFRVMRRCYDELGRPAGAPLATWQDAFEKHSFVVFEEHYDDRWQPWKVDFPENGSVPGEGGVLPTPWDYLTMLIGWARELLEGSVLTGLSAEQGEALVAGAAPRAGALAAMASDGAELGSEHPLRAEARSLLGGVVGRTKAAEQDIEAVFAHLAHGIAKGFGPDAGHHDAAHHRGLEAILRRLRDWVRGRVESELEADPELRQLFVMIDLSVSCAIGMLVDRLLVPPVDWFKIDDRDFRRWIMDHGASRMTAWSGPINAAYALAFGEHTEIGAGTGMHGILRLIFTYKGAIFWEMQAGMGDTIFAPLYEVLRRRGVRFHFFHRVDRLELDDAGGAVARVHIGRQVVPRGTYEPLFDVEGLPCWPSEPFYEQLEGGEELARSGEDLEDGWTRWRDRGEPLVLEHGRDFDTVLLGTAIGSYPVVASELMLANPRFREMVERVQTTQTQALQLWFGPDLAELGWRDPKPIVGSYAMPFDTWADMTHLIPREAWPAGQEPGSLAYLVSRLEDDEPMPPPGDHEYTARQAARVRRHALDWLTTEVRALWPSAAQPDDPDALDWSKLVAPAGHTGPERLDAQYWRATVNPSERYVLSLPGSTRYRLRVDETGFANVVMCGDHTYTAINAGCIEAATMSGMQASRAIAGTPARIIGGLPGEDEA